VEGFVNVLHMILTFYVLSSDVVAHDVYLPLTFYVLSSAVDILS
jgi:hypothetical protein